MYLAAKVLKIPHAAKYIRIIYVLECLRGGDLRTGARQSAARWHRSGSSLYGWAPRLLHIYYYTASLTLPAKHTIA